MVTQHDSLFGYIPLVLVLISLAAALCIFPVREERTKTRSTINITAAIIKLGIIATVVPSIIVGDERPEISIPFLPEIDLVLRMDQLSVFFAGLSSFLWLLTTIYAIGYLKNRPNKSRFFGFFSLCVTATVGLSFSGNLITFLVFYELLTLVTYPLVAHWGTPASLHAARVYLRYALAGGLSLLVGVAWLTIYAGPLDFAPGGAQGVTELAAHSPTVAVLIFFLLVGGLAVKAALFPLHGWLPKAMVAPAPVSALLHAVAVVKAGVFGLVRVIDDVYGIDVAHQLGVLTPILVLACFTILYGSYLALRAEDLKERLAYSTVSQVSYVAVGITLFTVVGTTGGVVHLVHQGLMKITLFFCAGLFTEALGVTKISQMSGLGRKMPLTSLAFTVGAFGMIGLPPTAGFISKWTLGTGALESAHPWVLLVLVASAVLNALYFLPVVYRMWFHEPTPSQDAPPAVAIINRVKEPLPLLVPALTTAVVAVVVGLLASVPFAPLWIAEQIAEGVFG